MAGSAIHLNLDDLPGDSLAAKRVSDASAGQNFARAARFRRRTALPSISFRRSLTPQQTAALPMRSPLGMWGSIFGLALASATVLHTMFSTSINAIGGLAFLAALTLAYFLLKRSRQS